MSNENDCTQPVNPDLAEYLAACKQVSEQHGELHLAQAVALLGFYRMCRLFTVPEQLATILVNDFVRSWFLEAQNRDAEVDKLFDSCHVLNNVLKAGTERLALAVVNAQQGGQNVH